MKYCTNDTDCGFGFCEENWEKRGHICICNHGYTGTKCLQTIGHCSEDTCKHGKCNAGTCVCDLGYAGKSCDLLESQAGACSDATCLNGHCEEDLEKDGHKCVCEDGYEGDYCQYKTRYCVDADCGDGICEEDWENRGHNCICEGGLEGCAANIHEYLENERERCNVDKCGHGRCIEDPDHNRYICVCNDGYSVASNCEDKIVYCKNDTYCGHGTCQEDWEHYRHRYTDHCLDYDCGHGHCVYHKHEETKNCSCYPGYKGERCGERIDYCNELSVECGDHGTCHEFWNEQTAGCFCETNYYGDHCQFKKMTGCQNLRHFKNKTQDGEYEIFFGPHNNYKALIYCKHMHTDWPEEFLTLVNVPGNYVKNGSGIVYFHRIRIDIHNMRLITNVFYYTSDSTMATAMAQNVNYGEVAECAGPYITKGEFSIDLTGTPFHVKKVDSLEDRVIWKLFGNESAQLLSPSYPQGQTVSGFCGGNCGGCWPMNHQIPLRYMWGNAIKHLVPSHPRSCSELKDDSGLIEDGTFQLYFGDKMQYNATFYCNNMKYTPEEYLILYSRNNFAHADSTGVDGKEFTFHYAGNITYNKVRVNLEEMFIDTYDGTFAAKVGPRPPYMGVGYGCRKNGTFAVDLKHTVFQIDMTRTEWEPFQIEDSEPYRNIFSQEKQDVTGFCRNMAGNGKCGGCRPKNGRIYIKYLGPDFN
ncbi:uncharacterized protein LOC141911599 [Tubulanus polymorphus]|uniref:uncharacterized protein LOC141911599 n=1 Tax=Tubulanus polymorphus TaxID=672921 RepID=UPI003DA382B9